MTRTELPRFEVDDDGNAERLVHVVRQIKAIAIGPMQEDIAEGFCRLLGINQDRYFGATDVAFTTTRVILLPAPSGPTGTGINVTLIGAVMGGAIGGAIAGVGSQLANAIASKQARPVGDPLQAPIDGNNVPSWPLKAPTLKVQETRRSLFPPDYAILFKISGPCHYSNRIEQMDLMFAIQGRVTKTSFGNSRPEAYGPIASIFGFKDSMVSVK